MTRYSFKSFARTFWFPALVAVFCVGMFFVDDLIRKPPVYGPPPPTEAQQMDARLSRLEGKFADLQRAHERLVERIEMIESSVIVLER